MADIEETQISDREFTVNGQFGLMGLTVGLNAVYFSIPEFRTSAIAEPAEMTGWVSLDPIRVRVHRFLHVWSPASALLRETTAGADLLRNIEMALLAHRDSVLSALQQAAAALSRMDDSTLLLPYPLCAPRVINLAVAVHEEPDEGIRFEMAQLAHDFTGTPDELREAAAARMTPRRWPER